MEALVRRAHEGLGHPGKERFVRILKGSNLSPQVLEIAKRFDCAVCAKFKRPLPSRQAAPPREIGLNDLVGVDSIQIRVQFSQKVRYLLNIIDYHSHFQMVIPLTDHTAHAARQGYRMWLKLFGPPKKLYVDLGKEFMQAFVYGAEQDGSEVIPSSLETPEQRGFVERHGQMYKEMLYKTMEQCSCSDWPHWFEIVDHVCATKNRLSSRGGYSPMQRVFGYQLRLPGMPFSDGDNDTGVQSQVYMGEESMRRAMETREAAAKSFHELECAQALRAAATHGPRPHYDYQPGQVVFFWRRGADASRKPANYFWHGPARVVAVQLPTTVWLSYNRHLVKAAPEKLRPASSEESLSLSGWIDGLSHVKRQFMSDELKNLIDLSKEESNDLTPAPEDYWRVVVGYIVRVHLVSRERYYRPTDVELPVALEEIEDVRISKMTLEDGTTLETTTSWKEEQGRHDPEHGQAWTGETWFRLLPRPDGPLPGAQPRVRYSKKARLGAAEENYERQQPASVPPPGLPEPGSSADLESPLDDGASVDRIPEEAVDDAVDPAAVPLPSDASENLSEPADMEVDAARKRDLDPTLPTPGEWEEVPPSKRSRLELLELYYAEMTKHENAKQKKSKEWFARDFTGLDQERLQRAIQKEVNQNMASGAYKLLSVEDSREVRQNKPDLVMKSRYVLTKKPLESHEIDSAKAEDILLDESGGIPSKAKCRHVMQGYSEAAILDLDTTTPQVHQDTVIYTAQTLVSMGWEAGFADFSQVFHSGDAIEREVYAELPPEGIPGSSRGQLLKLLKTCYGLTDGPAAWFKHIKKLLTSLGYRQSVIDPCLFFLDAETDSTKSAEDGHVGIDGIIAVATDDLLHGGTSRHRERMDNIRSRYKLGKYTWGSGRFVGKNFARQADGSMVIEQAFYTENMVRPIPLSKERKRRRYSPCTSEELEQLRALVGVLAWLSKETRCDLAGRVALLQQAFPRPQVRDLIAGNQLAGEALKFKELGVHVMPIPMDRLQVGVATDASWGNSRELGAFAEETTADVWEETETEWIRVHRAPRRLAFHPAAAPGGPDLHDLQACRVTKVLGDRDFQHADRWTTADGIRVIRDEPWTGRTIFRKQPSGEELPHSEVHSGHEQLAKLFSQGGEIVFFYDKDLPRSQELQNVTLSAWKSYRLRRRTVNTLSSETQALVRGLSSVHWYRVLILEARGLRMTTREWHHEVSQLPFICVTDSKSLYDMIQKCMNPASQCEDRRTSIDVALIKQELQDLTGSIRWVDGRTMISDSLTKVTKSDYLRHVMRSGQWSILEEGASLQRKLLERQGGAVHFLLAV